ncbi:hypothetical protein LTR22_012695 [Elasticomyces elasticus]|nr:hypothetical protein LTR22_012695 [Elasticomyces elasticus]KAK4920063.1 hypothetical protein LTR49_012324 [Elasticomyces elasticus]
MASTNESASAQATLRAITYRLSTTPSKQLPQVAAQLSGHLWACKDLISSPAVSAKQGNEATITVSRFKTYLSTLLQDRTIEGRWAAVVLVKAAIEAGGAEVLSKSNAWVRSLLAILKRPDPPTTRILAVLTLTRIFTLTWDYTNLIREITTPALPAFISTCLSNAENQRCSSNELCTILDAFATLISRHPTMFRTNEAQIRSLLVRIVSSTSSVDQSSRYYTLEHRESAQSLLVLLHNCAPKQGAANKWDETLKATVTAAHTTCDRIFRSVIEDWTSTSGVQPSLNVNALLQGDVELEGDDTVGMTRWKGVHAGSERLVALLDLLATQLSTATAGAVTVRLGLVVDLLTRLFALRSPRNRQITITPNQQVSKDERDALFAVLPEVHVAALALTQTLLQNVGDTAASVVQPLLAQTTWLFKAESFHAGVRTATYEVLATVLELQGPSIDRDDVSDIESIVKACCEDLLPANQTKSTVDGTTSTQAGQTAVIGLHSVKASSGAAIPAILRMGAEALLPLCFSNINSAHIPGRLRTLMERTAVLTQHKKALVASVLNPASNGSRVKTQPSLLPLLAKQYPHSTEVEALLRPRMPVIRTGVSGADEDEDEDEVEDEYGLPSPIANGHEEVVSGAPEAAQISGEPDTVLAEEDLYSASPKRQVEAGSSEGLLEKRKQSNDNVDADRSVKRMRASPPLGVPIVSASNDALAPDEMALQGGPSQQTASQLEPAKSYEAGNMVDIGSDGSDFEMPPLTMEQDTEDEEEESEDEVAGQ